MKPVISFDDFSKLDLRVGKITQCSKKEGSAKLLRLTVDFGQEGSRTILSGLAQWYTPEYLTGKEFIFVFNLAPRSIMGEESAGMILAADGEKPLPIKPVTKTIPGTAIR